MAPFFRKAFSSPIFEQDDEKTRAAAILNPILLLTMFLLALLTIAQGFLGDRTYLSDTVAVLSAFVVISAILWSMMKRGFVRQAGFIFVFMGWVAMTYQAWRYAGFRDGALLGYFVVILVATISVGVRTGIVYTTLSLISCWTFAYLETIGRYSSKGDPAYTSVSSLSVVFLLVAFISYLAVSNINQSLKIARKNESDLRQSNQELRALHTDLEKRVQDRTTDLERRTTEIQTAALIARDASIAKNVDVLLNRTVQLLQLKFGYYHIGIFFIDDNGGYAILKAAGSEAGKLMLANNYKIRVGEHGLIGQVSRTGEPHIALDVGADAAHAPNPLLPYTRSEMVLPLRVESRIIGVLDIQSDKVNAFDQTSISMMQIITDQISIAIGRIRLIQELQQNTTELERVLQENTARTWRSFLRQIRKRAGFRYEGVTVEPLQELPREGFDAMQKNEPTVTSVEKNGSVDSTLAVPIKIRGQTLGVLTIQFKGKDIPAESSVLAGEAANRLALALENARLVQDAQRLANREQQINKISAQIQQSTDLDVVLQNTIRELGDSLGVPKTFIQIGLTPARDQLDTDQASES
ncbi:MAG TPA: GAF domain-containing protein [Anaerolineales bacterium]|nr:GAF domain-containing protein [Anaerolineales bacterium]